RPPFRSDWPEIPSDDKVKRFEEDEAWKSIVSSVRSAGSYGDFGRYIMEAEVYCFSNKPLSDRQPDSKYRERFPAAIAQRWILQRVEDLGWTDEYFGEYESHVPSGRHHHNVEDLKLERISKKYQWIA